MTPQKRVDQFLDLAVTWCLPRAAPIRDEPQAYRASCIRQGVEIGLRARLSGEFLASVAQTVKEDNVL